MILPPPNAASLIIAKQMRMRYPKVPKVPSAEQALDQVKEVGEHDQMKLREFQRTIADTKPIKKVA